MKETKREKVEEKVFKFELFKGWPDIFQKIQDIQVFPGQLFFPQNFQIFSKNIYSK